LSDSVDQLIERHIRRGNLRDALDLLERLIAQNPGEQRWVQKAQAVQEMLQPGELVNPKSAAPPAEPRGEVLSFGAPAPVRSSGRKDALEAILQRIARNRRPAAT
jgi:hypothetical protein